MTSRLGPHEWRRQGGGSEGGLVASMGGGLAGMATHPLTVWSITTSGGLLLFLLLLRRSKDGDDRLVAEGLAVVAAAGGSRPGSGCRPDARAWTQPPARPDRPVRRCCRPCRRRAPSTSRPARDAEQRAGRLPTACASQLQARIPSARTSSAGSTVADDGRDRRIPTRGFLQVRTPDGITGWIPRHTIVGAPTG